MMRLRMVCQGRAPGLHRSPGVTHTGRILLLLLLMHVCSSVCIRLCRCAGGKPTVHGASATLQPCTKHTHSNIKHTDSNITAITKSSLPGVQAALPAVHGAGGMHHASSSNISCHRFKGPRESLRLAASRWPHSTSGLQPIPAYTSLTRQERHTEVLLSTEVLAHTKEATRTAACCGNRPHYGSSQWAASRPRGLLMQPPLVAPAA